MLKYVPILKIEDIKIDSHCTRIIYAPLLYIILNYTRVTNNK